MKSRFTLFLFFLAISFSVNAQDLWIFENDSPGLSKGMRFDSNNPIQTVSLDRSQLDASITKIDSQSSFLKTEQITIVFPNESGKSEKFSVREVSLLSSELSKEHPNIKTFVGTSLSRKNVHARWSISPLGVNAMIDSPEGQFFLQPDRSGDKNKHLFYKRGGILYDDFEPLNCLVAEDKTTKKREKLLKIVSNDVDRIERLITDYSQVLKDEASQSRSVPKDFDLVPVIESVIEDFNTDPKTMDKNISIHFENLLQKNKAIIFGIESRIEQVIANVLENAISFSPTDDEVQISLSKKNNLVL